MKAPFTHNKRRGTVDLDGTAGFGTSFLEESFGGLIRENQISFDTIVSHIKFVSNEQPDLIDDINQYLSDARNEAGKK